MSNQHHPSFISPAEVRQMVGLSEATLYRLRERGEFPPPVKFSKRKIVYSTAQVEAWIASRVGSKL